MTTYVYHYCASYRMEGGGIHRTCGLAVRTAAISSDADYGEFLSALADSKGWPADGFMLDSLSFLHQTED